MIKGLGSRYSVEMWFYNELPADIRGVTGYLFSRALGNAMEAAGDQSASEVRTSRPGDFSFPAGRALEKPFRGKLRSSQGLGIMW